MRYEIEIYTLQLLSSATTEKAEEAGFSRSWAAALYEFPLTASGPAEAVTVTVRRNSLARA